jgi:hypothetical protein
MESAIALLISANLLLAQVQAAPNLPQSFKDEAIKVANTAIEAGTIALAEASKPIQVEVNTVEAKQDESVVKVGGSCQDSPTFMRLYKVAKDKPATLSC